MSYGKRILFDTVRTLAAGSIAAGYTAVGTALDFPTRIIHVQNLTDATVMFSMDGVNDHFPLIANAFLLLDISANAAAEDAFFLSVGDVLYVKQVGVPTTGSVYFTTAYGKGD